MEAFDETTGTRALLRLMNEFFEAIDQTALTNQALRRLVLIAEELLDRGASEGEMIQFFRERIPGFRQRLDERRHSRSFRALVESMPSDPSEMYIVNENILDDLCPRGPCYEPILRSDGRRGRG
jgi:hypothetical protein